MERFGRLNAQVLGVSGDNREALARFREEFSITFPMIADLDNRVRKAYGWGRVTYIIDLDGTVRFKQVGMPDNEALLRELERLK